MAKKPVDQTQSMTAEAMEAEVISAVNDSEFKVGEPVETVDLNTCPILTSIGITKTKEGWVFFKMTTQNDKVLSVDYSQDNLRSAIISQFKIEAYKTFMEE